MPARVLLVDDSEAVLAYERAALSQHYVIDVAIDGVEGLRAARALSPAVVVLDLSMPRMDGDDVLAALKSDPLLRDIPVIIVSSEETRGQACLRGGAVAFLPKPVRASDLLTAVNRAYDEAAALRSGARLHALFVSVGEFEIGLSVSCVHSVMLQPATRPFPGGPSTMSESVELPGETVAVLDLAACFDIPHAMPRVDRRLVVIEDRGQKLALCVDGVHGPEEIDPADVTSPGTTESSEIAVMARTIRGKRAIVHPSALFAPDRLPHVASLARQARCAHPASTGFVTSRVPSESSESSEPSDHRRDARTEHLLDRRAARASLPRPDDEEDFALVAQLRVGAEQYSIPLESLLGVIPFGAVVPVPLSPRPILGVLHFRGEIITALSTAWLLGVPDAWQAPTSLLVARAPSGRRFAMDCAEVPAVVPLRRRGVGTAPPLRLLDLDGALDRL